MINSDERKLNLSGWLKEYDSMNYNNPLKLQKFLFFYEAFSKVAGENANFDSLKGYKRGPVFSNVWGDYTKERGSFDIIAEKTYKNRKNEINNDRAKKCAFMISTMTEDELSMLTHQMNIWKCKEEQILNGQKQVPLSVQDFNDSDNFFVKQLESMYSIETIDNSEIQMIYNKYFVFKKTDIEKLKDEHFDTMLTLVATEILYNPIYVEIDEEGRLLID